MAKKPLPGQPGNPGRPKGAKGKKLQMLESKAPALIEKLVEMALKGDPTALRLCIDRLLPRLRAQAESVKIAAGDETDLATQGQRILDAALAGTISPCAARDLLSAVTGQARVVEVTALEERLRALEQRDDQPPWESESKLPLRGKRRTNDE